jgi:predicted transcriptional regulator
MIDLWTDARARVQRLPLSELTDVAAGSGVPLTTLVKIKYGTTRNPRVETVMKLIEHFQQAERVA